MAIRILIVEDEEPIAVALKNDLTLEGYVAEVVGDGDSAIERATRFPFDLIVLDVMLPNKDGFAVCRELRRGGSKTPVILLTARAQDTDKVLGLEIGADDYVTKPFSPMELRARIKAVLRRTAGRQVWNCQFGDVEVDFARCTAHKGGRPVDLTPLELKVLAALVEAGGHMLTRAQLIERVWGVGIAITDRVVDTHVLNLRRKLEDVPAEPRFLLSVRGLGYRFENRAQDPTDC